MFTSEFDAEVDESEFTLQQHTGLIQGYNFKFEVGAKYEAKHGTSFAIAL